MTQEDWNINAKKINLVYVLADIQEAFVSRKSLFSFNKPCR